MKEVSIDESGEKIEISINDGTLVFDRKTGLLEVYSMDGLDLLAGGPFPEFFGVHQAKTILEASCL